MLSTSKPSQNNLPGTDIYPHFTDGEEEVEAQAQVNLTEPRLITQCYNASQACYCVEEKIESHGKEREKHCISEK